LAREEEACLDTPGREEEEKERDDRKRRERKKVCHVAVVRRRRWLETFHNYRTKFVKNLGTKYKFSSINQIFFYKRNKEEEEEEMNYLFSPRSLRRSGNLQSVSGQGSKH